MAWAAYAAVALPLGLLTGFLTWHPAVDVAGLLATPVLIYTLTAVPEEFLFRGVIQNLLTRWWGPHVGLGVAAGVFGLAHLPDLRYVLLATLAGSRVWVGVCPDRQDYRVGPDSHRGELDLGITLVVPMRMSSHRLSFWDIGGPLPGPSPGGGTGAGWGPRHAASPVRAAPDRRQAGPRRRAVPARG